MNSSILCRSELLALDLKGRSYVITGANSGLGFETARQLASQGAYVVLACRSRKKGDTALLKIRASVPDARLEVMTIDMADLRSVRDFAAHYAKSHAMLHGLVNNAGIFNAPQGRTKDGFELQLGTNHLGHFLLTELLTALLKSSAPSRIVNLSSCYHDRAMGRDGDIHFEDLQFQRGTYDGWKAYAQSKLANLLHAQELGRRLQGTGVTAASVHPGWVRTNIMRHSKLQWFQDIVRRGFGDRIGFLDAWQGIQVTLHALLAPEVETQSGQYFSQIGHYRISSAKRGGLPLTSPNPNAHDLDKARRLWEVSTQLVGL